MAYNLKSKKNKKQSFQNEMDIAIKDGMQLLVESNYSFFDILVMLKQF